MEIGKNEDSQEYIQIRVADTFQQLLVVQLAKASGLQASATGRSRKSVVLCCGQEEADALMRDAAEAASVLQLLQLEAVAKTMNATGVAPPQNLLDMVAEMRSRLGALVAGV
jgi:hypothetical protein